jgi:RecB family exonuclease
MVKPLSRSRVERFIECPRCFWLENVARVPRPSGPPFSLNIAVDHLLKNEFDRYRESGKVPPRLAAAGIDLVPCAHPDLHRWRSNFKGVRVQHAATGLTFFGAIDDLWRGPDGLHHVVDYKATSKAEEVSLDADWQVAYKRQAEFYQWLLRGEGLKVSPRAF